MKKGYRRMLVLAASALMAAGSCTTAWADSVSLKSSSEIASGESDAFTTAVVNGQEANVWQVKKDDKLVLDKLDLPYVNYRELSVGILYPQPDGTYQIDVVGDETDYAGGAGNYLMIDTDLNVGEEYPVYDLLKNSGDLGGHTMEECLFFLMFRYDKEGEDTVWTGDIYLKFVGTAAAAGQTEPGGTGAAGSGSGQSGEAGQGQDGTPAWVSDANGWRLEYPDGTYLVNDWYQSPESGLWYYMGADGYMLKGRWIQPVSDGDWYYLSDDGHMRANQWFWSPDDGNWYYLGSDGHMLVDTTTPDGFRVDESGVWIQ